MSPPRSNTAVEEGSKKNRIRMEPVRSSFMFWWRLALIRSTAGRPSEGPVCSGNRCGLQPWPGWLRRARGTSPRTRQGHHFPTHDDSIGVNLYFRQRDTPEEDSRTVLGPIESQVPFGHAWATTLASRQPDSNDTYSSTAGAAAAVLIQSEGRHPRSEGGSRHAIA